MINNTDFTKVIQSESTTTVTITNNNATTSAGPTVLTNKSIASALISATEIETGNTGVFNNSKITDKTAYESKTGTGTRSTECQAHDYNNGTEPPSEIKSDTVTEVKRRQAMMAQTFFVCPNENCKFFTQYRSLFDAHVTLKHINSPPKKLQSGGSERKRRSENSQKIPTFCTAHTDTDTNTEPIENGWRNIDIPYFDIIDADPQTIISAVSNQFIGVPSLNTALLNADARPPNSTPFTTETEGVQTSKPGSAIVVKRRRGRPRKNIVEENSNICTMFSSSSSNSATNARASSIPIPSPSASKPAEKTQKITILNGSFKNKIAVINSANTITLFPAPAPEEKAETRSKGSKAKLKTKAKAKNIKKKPSPIINDGNDQTSAPLWQTGKARSKQGRKRKQKEPSGHFCTHPNCGFKSPKSEKMENHVRKVHSSSTSLITEAAVAATVSFLAKRKSKKTTVRAPDFGCCVMSDQLKPRPRPSYKKAEQDVSENEDEVYKGQMQNFRKVSVIQKLPTRSETEIVSENGQEAAVETNQSEIDRALVSVQELQLSLSTFPVPVTGPDPSNDPVTDPDLNFDQVISPGPNNIDPVNDPDLNFDQVISSGPNIDPVNDPDTSINSVTDPDPDPNIDPVTDLGPDRSIGSFTDSDPNSNIDLVIDSDHASNINAITDSGTDFNIDPVTDPDSDSNVDLVTGPDPDSNVDPVTDPEHNSYIHLATDSDPDSNIDPITDPDPGCRPISETTADAVYQSCENENGLETNNKAEPRTVADAIQPKIDVNSDQKNDDSDDFPKIVSVYSTPVVSGPVAGLGLEVLTETRPVSSPPPPTPPLIDLTLSSPESCTEAENELNESKNVVYDAALDLMDETDFLSMIAADVGMDLQSICDAPIQSVSHMAVDTEKNKSSYAKKQENPEPSQPVPKTTLFQPWLDTPSLMKIQPPPLPPYLEPQPESKQQPQLTSDRVSFPPSSPYNKVFKYNCSCGSRTVSGDKNDWHLRSHSMCLGQQFHSYCIHPHPTVLMTKIKKPKLLCASSSSGPGAKFAKTCISPNSQTNTNTSTNRPSNITR